MTILAFLAYAVVLDTQLRAYLAKVGTCGGPYAGESYQWIKRWHEERGLPFAVRQGLCSDWLRGQGLIGEKHAVMYTAIGRSSRKDEHARAKREARDRRRQMREERRQGV